MPEVNTTSYSPPTPEKIPAGPADPSKPAGKTPTLPSGQNRPAGGFPVQRAPGSPASLPTKGK